MKTRKNESGTKNESTGKSHVILAMALIATVAIVVIFVATYLLIQSKFKEPLRITLTDWFKMILPVAGGAIVSVFAFLGVDRLKDFDDRQDRLARELRDDVDVQIENAVKLVRPKLDEAYDEWEEGIKKKLQGYEDSLNSLTGRIHKYDKILGSVEKIEEISDAIGNVSEAHTFLSELFSELQGDDTDRAPRTRAVFALVDRVKCGEIGGDSADYHNLASELARHDYHGCAADVVNKGLEFFDGDIDLLSDYIYYSRAAGRKKEVADGITRLQQIDYKMWNWRAFTFYISVLNDMEASEDNKERTLEYVKKYKEVLPDEERAYMAEYETYKKYGDLRSAEAALIQAEKKFAMTAQCSLTLSEIYHMRGEFDKAIRSATKAIQGQAEEQPSSNTGAAYAQRGFSKDAKIHRDLVDGIVTINHDVLRSAIRDYEMGMRLGCRPANVRVRIKILQDMLPDEEKTAGVYDALDERIRAVEMAVEFLLSELPQNSEK